MQFVYPYTVREDEHGFFQVRFPDVPEALTEGESEAEALALAPDVLLAALGALMKMKRAIPAPSNAAEGQHVVVVPVLAAAKMALYQAMQDQGINKVVLARDLGKQESEVRRMLDLDHDTKIATVEFALWRLGKRLQTEVKEAA